MSTKKAKQISSRKFIFRLTEQEAEKYDNMCKDLCITRTELLKSLLNKSFKSLGNKELTTILKRTKIIPCQKDHKQLLFYYNKASNNLNQIAKKLNIAFAKNIVNESIITNAINHLKSIEDVLLELAKMPKDID